MKEQVKTPNETKISNLPDKVSHKDAQESWEELKRVKKYNKPIRDEEHNNYNENALEGIKIRLVKMEEQISDLKDRIVEIAQSE